MIDNETIAYYFLVIICALLHIYYRKVLNNYWVLFFIPIGLFTDLVGHKGHEEVYHLYHALEYFFLSMAFRKEIKNLKMKSFILWTMPIFWILFISGIFIDGYYNPSTVNMSISTCGIVIYCLFYLKELYEPPFDDDRLIQRPFFWVAFGVLVYLTGLFLHLLLYSDIAQSYFFDNYTYYVLYVINCLFYLILIFSLLCRKIFN